MLAKESPTVAEKLIYLRCTHNLMVAMGNEDYADSQRQASIALEVSTIYFWEYFFKFVILSLKKSVMCDMLLNGWMFCMFKLWGDVAGI